MAVERREREEERKVWCVVAEARRVIVRLVTVRS